MNTSNVYSSIKKFRTPGHKHGLPPSLPPDACQYPRWHLLDPKLGCAGLILLFLVLIGLSVLVRFLVQNQPIKNYSVDAQENMTESTGRSVILKCPRDWHSYQNKCLSVSQTSGPWFEGLGDCNVKESTLLLIEDEKELRFIHDFSKRREQNFFIGLKYETANKIWKWINGSILNPDLLRVMGTDEEDSCAVISQTEVFSDFCSADNRWICQKKLKHV